MASESTIVRVLDLLTTASTATVESLRPQVKTHAKTLRTIVNIPNIVAVGVSEKISNKERTGKLALTFYVERKIPLSKLKANRAIPSTVPEVLSGAEAIPTDVVAIGKLKPQVPPYITRHPVQPGYSIGHKNITAGTFGAVVSKGDAYYILSNSHVLADSGAGKKGDEIVYPGPDDEGKVGADTVAKLADFHKFETGGDFVNRVDCAIAKPIPERLDELVSAIKDLGVPKGTITAKRGMKIVKVGRTTRKTTGEVKDVHFRFVLNYPKAGDVGYIDQIFCTRYSRGGDSGSLVLDEESGKAVGLHFAGAKGGSVCNPIDDVLTALGVKLVTKSIGKPAMETARPSRRSVVKGSNKKPTKKKRKGKSVPRPGRK